MGKDRQFSTDCENCVSLTHGIFCGLKDEELINVSKHKVSNHYKKGQTLFVQGNPSFGIFCLNSGNVKLTQVASDGKESIVRIAKGGDVIGHRSLLTDQYYQATATALDDTAVCFIDKKFILKLIQEQPSVASNLIGKLGRDLGAAEHKISSFYQKNVRERLAELLLLLKESHGVQTEAGILLDIQLTREEMASMIGTASETLIRFMSELRQEGLIAQQGKKLYVIDEKGLQEFSGEKY